MDAQLISVLYVLIFAKEMIKYLLSLHLCCIDSSVFDESVRKVVHKYEGAVAVVDKYDKYDVAASTKAHHHEYNVLSFHLSAHFLAFCQNTTLFPISTLLLCE